MKAKKKLVEINYFEINDTEESAVKFVQWINSFGDKLHDNFIIGDNFLKVKTLEGTSYNIDMEKDYIIRGVKGEYYPCKKDIFELTYDKVDD